MRKIFEKCSLKDKILMVFISVIVIAGCGKEEKKADETETSKVNSAHVESKPEAIKQAAPVPLKPVIAEPSALQ